MEGEEKPELTKQHRLKHIFKHFQTFTFLYEQKQAYYNLENIFGLSIILILTLQINYKQKKLKMLKNTKPNCQQK